MNSYRSVFEVVRNRKQYEPLGLSGHASFEAAVREIYLDPPPEGSGEDPSTEVVLPIRAK